MKKQKIRIKYKRQTVEKKIREKKKQAEAKREVAAPVLDTPEKLDALPASLNFVGSLPNGKKGPYCQVLLPLEHLNFKFPVPDGFEKHENKETGEISTIQLFRMKRLRKLPIVVRVSKGDERNGHGHIYEAPRIAKGRLGVSFAVFQVGRPVRWAGGSEQGLARITDDSLQGFLPARTA